MTEEKLIIKDKKEKEIEAINTSLIVIKDSLRYIYSLECSCTNISLRCAKCTIVKYLEDYQEELKELLKNKKRMYNKLLKEDKNING